MVHCGYNGVHRSCSRSFVQPAPRLGFAFDPKGDEKPRSVELRIFFEHANGNDPIPSRSKEILLDHCAGSAVHIGYTNIGAQQRTTADLYPLGGGVSQFDLITHHAVALHPAIPLRHPA